MKETLQDTPAAASVGAAVRSVNDLRGPAGLLEALFTPGRSDASYAVVVAHPHPLYGGTMHNKVVYHAAKEFQRFGLPVLRFNFRGAGLSEGVHDRGEGEQQDLLAAFAWLASNTGLPILLAGFSFGAWVMLRTCCSAGGVIEAQGLVALGLPIQAGDRGYTYDFLAECALPKLFVSGSADSFGPVAAIEAAYARFAPPSRLVWVADADHFFQGAGNGLNQMQAAIGCWLQESFSLVLADAPSGMRSKE